ncbi:MAG: metal-dependent transcriptional regulator [Nitrososphaerales archaeon]
MQEEYLVLIYRLEEREEVAKTGGIAKEFKVALGTVTNTVANLEKKGFLIHKPYVGIKLTEKGRKIALEIIRKHRLSERLLTDVLKIPWSATHDIACKLEHIINGNVTEAIEKVLKYPKTCPHGNPVPDKCGKILKNECEPLTNLPVKSKGRIMRIVNENEKLLNYIADLGLLPGVEIEVEEKIPSGRYILVKVSGVIYSLGKEVSSSIYVKREITNLATIG